MAVTIDSGPVEAEDQLRHVPQEKWRQLMLARRRFCEIHISYDCRCLVQFVNDAQEMFAALEFESPEAMIRNGYGLEPAEVALAVEWLQINPPKEPISLNQAVVLGSREIGIEGGRAGPGRGKKTADNISRLKHGTSRAYILARLDRDGHTKLADRVRAGEMSANAAAIEAGFRKQLTPLERIYKLLPKLGLDDMKYPWMPLFWGDFLANTMHLSAQEAGAYLFLIAHAWEHEGTIPAEPARLMRIAHVRQEWWPRVWKVLESFFEPETLGTHLVRYTHGRVQGELERLGKISNKRKAAAEQMHSKCIPFASTSTSTSNRDNLASVREGKKPTAPLTKSDDPSYRSPPRKKSDNVLTPLPDKQAKAKP